MKNYFLDLSEYESSYLKHSYNFQLTLTVLYYFEQLFSSRKKYYLKFSLKCSRNSRIKRCSVQFLHYALLILLSTQN
jgi:hypothetical protein